MPLSDLTVIDLTVARAGPTAVRVLADWGADVIRVEPPAGAGSADTARLSSDFQNLHRNKRSISVDLKSEAGHQVLMDLVTRADILVENWRPPVKGRLGIDAETLLEHNPRLIYASISGFGQDGPDAERGGVDQIAQGRAGLMSITGEPDGVPMRVGVPISDLAAGIHLATGILSAVHERSKSGKGQWIKTSLLEAMVAMLDFQATRWTVDGEIPGAAGNDHPTQIPMGTFTTADGHINIAGPSGRLWRGFCEAIARDDLLDDPRFITGQLRSVNRTALSAELNHVLETETTQHWIDVLDTYGVPCGPVQTIADAFGDHQIVHLGLTRTYEHPDLGPIDLIRNPVTMSRSIGTTDRPTPAHGQHTHEVLAELGYDDAAIAELQRSVTL
jgi:crotonobetainyl-CoA:carnitine CoA-transferase CaiB-like acyl-CoA transferase